MASFLGSIFGGASEKEAADKNRAELARYNQIGTTALDNGLNRATGAVTGARDAAGNLLSSNYGLYGDLRTAGTGILNDGTATSLAALERARGNYDPVAELGAKYGGATSLYLDSLGANGADGNMRARDAFTTGPGYEFTLDEGLKAINRRRAAGGMLASGNADLDALRYGTGYANQTYRGWQDQLAGFVNPELSATSGAASGRTGVDTSIANLVGADTLARLGLEQTVTGGQAGTNTARAANEVTLGNSLAGLYSGDATNRVGLAGNVTSGNMSANNLQAQGESQGARNLLNAGMGLASLAVGGLGGGSFGSLMGSAGNMASQYLGNGTGYQTNPWSTSGMFGSGGAGWAR